jgi:hypothetical protein
MHPANERPPPVDLVENAKKVVTMGSIREAEETAKTICM